METLWTISCVGLWLSVLPLAFLLLGALRVLGLLRQDLRQAERRLKRVETLLNPGPGGLDVGDQAPDFGAEDLAGTRVTLRDCLGRSNVLLVFLKGEGGPCKGCEVIVPELNRLHRNGGFRVLAVRDDTGEATRQWVSAKQACFPVLLGDRKLYEDYRISRVPLALVINPKGVIVSKALCDRKGRLRFLAARAREVGLHGQARVETLATADCVDEQSLHHPHEEVPS